MRLFEIVDISPKPSSKDSFDRQKRYTAQTRMMMVPDGRGAYSTVYSDPSGKRHSEVIKVSKDRKEYFKDPYEVYIDTVYKLQQAGNQNPYFPRILSHRAYIKDGEKHSVSRIEKLVPFRSHKLYLNVDLMNSITENIFYSEIDPTKIPYQIDLAIEGKSSDIKDQDLMQACNVIKGIISQSEGKFLSDVHSSNIMWRITGNMPQLVITDPLASMDF